MKIAKWHFSCNKEEDVDMVRVVSEAPINALFVLVEKIKQFGCVIYPPSYIGMNKKKMTIKRYRVYFTPFCIELINKLNININGKRDNKLSISFKNKKDAVLWIERKMKIIGMEDHKQNSNCDTKSNNNKVRVEVEAFLYNNHNYNKDLNRGLCGEEK